MPPLSLDIISPRGLRIAPAPLAAGDRVRLLGWDTLGTLNAIRPGAAWKGLDMLTVYTDAGTVTYCTPDDVERIG